MSIRASQKKREAPREDLLTVRYWDAEWNELEHLRIESAGSTEVLQALESWFVERDRLRANKLALSVLKDAVALTIGRDDEEA